MSEVGLRMQLFRDAYDKAVEANKSGDTVSAKRHFALAAKLMDEIADSGDPALCAERHARAEKLKYISDNLTVENTDGQQDNGDSEVSLLNIVKPEGVTLNSVIGLEQAKSAIRKLLINPLSHPDVYAKYGIKAGGAILLEGPPGTGKTMFARAVASELSVPFADINANTLVDSYIGKTGKNIDRLFAEAREYSKKNKTPIVMFFDEIDCIAQKRGGENKTAQEAVPTLIRQLDGFSTNSDDLVIIAATNIKESIDPAVLSRFRNVIYIPLPTLDDRAAMITANLSKLEKSDFDCIDIAAAAKNTDGFSGRDIRAVTGDLLYSVAARDSGACEKNQDLNALLEKFIEQRREGK